MRTGKGCFYSRTPFSRLPSREEASSRNNLDKEKIQKVHFRNQDFFVMHPRSVGIERRHYERSLMERSNLRQFKFKLFISSFFLEGNADRQWVFYSRTPFSRLPSREEAHSSNNLDREQIQKGHFRSRDCFVVIPLNIAWYYKLFPPLRED